MYPLGFSFPIKAASFLSLKYDDLGLSLVNIRYVPRRVLMSFTSLKNGITRYETLTVKMMERALPVQAVTILPVLSGRALRSLTLSILPYGF